MPASSPRIASLWVPVIKTSLTMMPGWHLILHKAQRINCSLILGMIAHTMYHIPCGLERREDERRGEGEEGGGEGGNVYVMVLFIIPSLMRLRQESQVQASLDYTVRLGGGAGKDIFSHTTEGWKSKIKGLGRQTLFHISLLALVTSGHCFPDHCLHTSHCRCAPESAVPHFIRTSGVQG